jgi:NodT family efflux transporter outer membrane factor (OMF) lipoprotein
MKSSTLLLAVLLAGCVSTNRAPLADGGPGLHQQGGIDAAVGVAARMPVSDAILDGLIRDATGSNLDLRAAAARVAEARALRGVAASRQKPRGGATLTAAEAQRSDAVAPFDVLPPGISFGDRRGEIFDAGFDASWELDWFGGVRRDVEAAIAEVQATEEGRRDVEITVAAEVARNYVELRGTQKRIDVLDERIRTLQETLDIVQARQSAGLTNDFDVVRSRALLETTLASRPALDYSAAAAMRRLAVLTGRQPEDLVELLAPHAEIPAMRSDPDGGTSMQAVAQRPDVRRAERELTAASARIDVARADLYPRIALFGGFGRRSDAAPDLLRSAATHWSFGPAVSWPLLTGGRVRAHIAAATARRDEAGAVYRHAVLKAMEEVDDSRAALVRDRQSRDRLVAAVASGERAVDLADARYRAGLDNFLAVLDAQRALRDSEDGLVQAQTATALSSIALYKTMGGAAP